jgi:hypothetical protein
MNRGINFDLPAGLLDAQVRDNTDPVPVVPVDIDCSTATGACWVVSQGNDFIVRMDFEGRKPTVHAPTGPGPFAQSPVIFTIDPANATSSGRNPRGIVLDADSTHGYVVCPTTRDVVVADRRQHRPQRVRSSELRPIGAAQRPARQDRLLHLASVLVRPRLGRLRVLPPRRPQRRRDVVVRGRSAPDHRPHRFSNTEGLADQRLLNWSPVATRTLISAEHAERLRRTRLITVNTDINMDGITPI